MNIVKGKFGFRVPLARLKTIEYLILHHTTDCLSVEKLNSYFLNVKKDDGSFKYNGFAYNFHISRKGVITEGRGLYIGGASGPAYNPKSLAIALEGNLETDHVTKEQFEALVWLVKKLMADHKVPIGKVLGHGDVAKTLCPGKNFPMKELKEKVTQKEEKPVIAVEHTPSNWAKESWEKACKKKGKDGKPIFDGTNPKESLTREQAAAVLDRLGLLD